MDQSRARELADEYLAEDEPTAWFDDIYAEGESSIPWAHSEPNRHLVEWLAAADVDGTGRRALVVGCGLGEDAEELGGHGFDVTGFDVSPTAVERCREQFSDSDVRYLVADLFEAPDDWSRAFDFVFESYTLQALPRPERERAVGPIADFVAPGGTLLVVTRGRDAHEAAGEFPWPLTREETTAFASHGLNLVAFDDFRDDRRPPVRRFRAEFRRPDRE
jgi:SAM-dependent methyltransferase